LVQHEGSFSLWTAGGFPDIAALAIGLLPVLLGLLIVLNLADGLFSLWLPSESGDSEATQTPPPTSPWAPPPVDPDEGHVFSLTDRHLGTFQSSLAAGHVLAAP
jgi:hypothetical protein